MKAINYKNHPAHLTEEEYAAVLRYIEKATDEEISQFLDVISVKFEGGNEGVDKEQVVFVVDSDTNVPEIKKRMIDFVHSK